MRGVRRFRDRVVVDKQNAEFRKAFDEEGQGMTSKTVKERLAVLEIQMVDLKEAVVNHTGQHTWDRVTHFMILLAQVAIILMLKFKVL